MKRTALRRTKPMRKCRLNKDGKPRERFEGLRDEDYRAWIHARPCLIASAHQCWSPERVPDAAHVESKARGAGDAGNLLSLCRRAHQELHSYGRRDFERTYKVSLAKVAGALWLEYERERGAPTL